MLEDMADVKSDLSKEAISAECAHEAEFLRGEYAELKKFWSDFDSALSEYKYNVRKPKRKIPFDLPGQQKLFEDEEQAAS